MRIPEPRKIVESTKELDKDKCVEFVKAVSGISFIGMSKKERDPVELLHQIIDDAIKIMEGE